MNIKKIENEILKFMVIFCLAASWVMMCTFIFDMPLGVFFSFMGAFFLGSNHNEIWSKFK